MKTIALIILVLIIPSCMEQSAKTTNPKRYLESASNEDSAYSPLERAEDALEMTEGIEEEVALAFHDVDSLTNQNKKLKKELKETIDSLKEAKKQLEIIRMVPKKRNFIQKVFNITPDSIQVKDTITN
jgi:GLPGLI family protein